ncbi:inositol monophosphatase family protein [uncultured Agrococcus sp.]|uniref:inositol monophosphatase family protein n=1 Tax=uncultured Agrococcus sp. TaxID=382258 RepID=UPI00260012D4|nr:inositol monophosphatase family protein [uncultured Agrococcus sp.]
MKKANPELTEFVIRTARDAGAIALEGFRSSNLQIDTKRDFTDVVTRYDRACETHIRAAILATYPDSSIVGEEQGETVGDGPLAWFIDPIDGTANYARGIALWAVSIGVALDGEIVAGAVYDPVADQLFSADDRGAFLEERGKKTPLRSQGATDAARATVATGFPARRDLVHHPDLALEQYARITREFAQVRGLGSTCIALCWIAAGWVDATISFETSPWDVAAAAFILRRAGGVYLAYRDGEPLPERGDFIGSHYYGAVTGSRFETLLDIMRTQSRRPVATAE